MTSTYPPDWLVYSGWNCNVAGCDRVLQIQIHIWNCRYMYYLEISRKRAGKREERKGGKKGKVREEKGWEEKERG